MARKPWHAAYQRMAPSNASFVSPYGLIGSVRSASAMGTRLGSPYTAAVDENTIRGTRRSRSASSSFTPFETFSR